MGLSRIMGVGHVLYFCVGTTHLVGHKNRGKLLLLGYSEYVDEGHSMVKTLKVTRVQVT